MKRFVQVLAGIILTLTVVLCGVLLYLRTSSPVFQGGSVLIVSPADQPALWASWMKLLDSDAVPHGETEDRSLFVFDVRLKNPGPIPVEWIGMTPELRPDETLVWTDNGSLVLAAQSEGTLKAAILSGKTDETAPRELTVSGYRLGEKVDIRLLADKNGIRMKGEE